MDAAAAAADVAVGDVFEQRSAVSIWSRRPMRGSKGPATVRPSAVTRRRSRGISSARARRGSDHTRTTAGTVRPSL